MNPTLKKVLFFCLSSLLGLIFIYSGYTKLYPIEPFELTFVDIGVSSWRIAPFIARFLIGAEFFIGFLLMFNIYIKRFTVKIALGTLLLFTGYLIFIIIKQGNNGNCGCFGQAIVMTPLQAIIKNIILSIALLFIYKFYDGIDFKQQGKWLVAFVFLSSLSLPYILNYVDLNYSEAYLTPKENQFELSLDSLYKHAKVHTPPQNLKTGKHIIAFMSLTCHHCRIAGKKLRLLKQQNPKLPIYFVLNGDYKNIQPFYEDTKARNIDYCILNGKSFMYMAGLELPAIFLVNNSKVEHWVNYTQLDLTELEKWINEP